MRFVCLSRVSSLSIENLSLGKSGAFLQKLNVVKHPFTKPAGVQPALIPGQEQRCPNPFRSTYITASSEETSLYTLYCTQWEQIWHLNFHNIIIIDTLNIWKARRLSHTSANTKKSTNWCYICTNIWFPFMQKWFFIDCCYLSSNTLAVQKTWPEPAWRKNKHL